MRVIKGKTASGKKTTTASEVPHGGATRDLYLHNFDARPCVSHRYTRPEHAVSRDRIETAAGVFYGASANLSSRQLAAWVAE